MGIHILTKFHKGNLRGVGVGWSLRSRRSPGVRSLCAAWVLCGRFLPEENAGIWRVWQLSDLGTPHCHMELVGSWTCKRSDSLSLSISLISYLILSLLFFPGSMWSHQISIMHRVASCKCYNLLFVTLRQVPGGVN
jgi:hypothetical protein